MPVQRRSMPRFLIALLAVPVIVAVYLSFFARRSLSAGRWLIVGVLGATVIGTVYAETAARHAVAPARRAPVPLTLLIGLALVFGAGMPATPARAANAQAEAVVDAALSKLGAKYVWAAEGPDVFDCSGLVYFAFKRAGELPLIGNGRTTAARYMKWFSSRGLTSKTDGKRGDLVIYGKGAHIGIYLGNGKVVSAVAEGVRIHGLHALQNDFTTFLTVAWGRSVKPVTSADDNNNPNSGGQANEEQKPAEEPADSEPAAGNDDDSTTTGKPAAKDVIARGHAFGSLNMRVDHAPGMRVIGWVSRGTTFDILATGHSPSGALWYKVRKPSGKEGWIWSHWVRVIEGSVDN